MRIMPEGIVIFHNDYIQFFNEEICRILRIEENKVIVIYIYIYIKS